MSVSLRWALATPVLLLAGYTMFSIKQYFGFRRAAGIDHFDPAFRSKPLVRRGMFKWTRNAMYVFAIQGTWLFGILAASKLAMLAACFQSVYIWVHYFGTEKPDMAYLYGAEEGER
jgi:protein-S-isoprenylcysteine O-methyltransferase Ste14